MDRHDDRIAEFHRLHDAGCFVMPNPWDAGSARALEQLGFRALATTSAGLAWTLGHADTEVTLDQVLDHLREIAAAVSVPVNADFEGGYAVQPADVAANVARAADTGIAGLSIEDASGDPADPLLDLDLAVARVAAARRAIDQSGTGIVLTGRSEGFVCGRPDIDETIRRLRAYADAGADCLYAPRIESLEHVSAIVSAVAPRPVNLLDQRAVHHRHGGSPSRRAADQRGRHARARGVERVPRGGGGDRRGGDVLTVRGAARRRRPPRRRPVAGGVTAGTRGTRGTRFGPSRRSPCPGARPCSPSCPPSRSPSPSRWPARVPSRRRRPRHPSRGPRGARVTRPTGPRPTRPASAPPAPQAATCGSPSRRGGSARSSTPTSPRPACAASSWSSPATASPTASRLTWSTAPSAPTRAACGSPRSTPTPTAATASASPT